MEGGEIVGLAVSALSVISIIASVISMTKTRKRNKKLDKMLDSKMSLDTAYLFDEYKKAYINLYKSIAAQYNDSTSDPLNYELFGEATSFFTNEGETTEILERMKVFGLAKHKVNLLMKLNGILTAAASKTLELQNKNMLDRGNILIKEINAGNPSRESTLSIKKYKNKNRYLKREK